MELVYTVRRYTLEEAQGMMPELLERIRLMEKIIILTHNDHDVAALVHPHVVDRLLKKQKKRRYRL